MKKSRRGVEVFSLSFLDVICCGFGAIILLLVLVKIGEPRALEAAQAERIGLVAKLQEELYDIRGETNVLNRKLVTKREQISEERVQVARLRGDLSKIQGQFAASAQLSEISDIVEGRLLAAQQELSEEQKRLRGKRSRPRPKDAPIGGIPVDSEYIIFIIDTSGSMKRFAWPLVMKKLEETLRIYPKVKGIQVMNDISSGSGRRSRIRTAATRPRRCSPKPKCSRCCGESSRRSGPQWNGRPEATRSPASSSIWECWRSGARAASF